MYSAESLSGRSCAEPSDNEFTLGNSFRIAAVKPSVSSCSSPLNPGTSSLLPTRFMACALPMKSARANEIKIQLLRIVVELHLNGDHVIMSRRSRDRALHVYV